MPSSWVTSTMERCCFTGATERTKELTDRTIRGHTLPPDRPGRFVLRCDALAVLTLLGAMLSLAGGAAAVPPAGNLEPKITDENGAPTIALPEALLKQIQTKYPGFRVPRKEDVTGEWANTRTTDQVP